MDNRKDEIDFKVLAEDDLRVIDSHEKLVEYISHLLVQIYDLDNENRQEFNYWWDWLVDKKEEEDA